jgi:hypothetical protein
MFPVRGVNQGEVDTGEVDIGELSGDEVLPNSQRTLQMCRTWVERVPSSRVGDVTVFVVWCGSVGYEDRRSKREDVVETL